MYTIKLTSQFKKDIKTVSKRGYEISHLNDVLKLLADGIRLPEKYRDHPLSGKWRSHRECHICPDWLLIYKIEGEVLVLTVTRTGSHSDLF